MRRGNGTAGHVRGPAGRMTAHKNKRALQWDTHTRTKWFCKSGDLGEAKLSSFQHYVCANCQRCSLLFHNDDQEHWCTRSFSFLLYQQPCLPNDKRLFYDPTFLFLYVLCDTCCPGYFPDPSLNPTHPFNAVDKCRQTGFSSGTSWLSARCWKNTYPHSPASNSFSGIDVQQHSGQINLIQGKLPIVHAVKQDETWNTLTHNEQCVCLLCNLPPNFHSFFLPLVLSWHHNPERQLPWQQQSGFAPQ